MNNNQTTIKDNPVALAQHELNAAFTAMQLAGQAYSDDHSDANLQALVHARARYERVEQEIVRSVRSLLIGA